MKGYAAFLKKELLEQLRTYKVLLMAAVFFALGMMSPLSAKLLPKLLQNFSGNGVEITLQAEPSALDSYMQFFKNTTQIGFVLLLLVFSGLVSAEISKGTLINMLTKGLSRTNVLLAKYTGALIAWSGGYLICAGTAVIYTEVLFPDDKVYHLPAAMLYLWLFGVFLLAVLVLASVLTKGSYGGLLLTAALVGVMLLVNLFPAAADYNPISLTGGSGLLMESASVRDMYPAAGITVLLTVLCLLGAVLVFRKKKL